MRNGLGGTHELSVDSWILSIVRRQAGEHVFLVIEGLDEEGSSAAFQADLGYKMIPT